MRKYLVRLVALLAPLLLTACLVTPGKFTSTMDIARNGEFTFRYQGEIYMTGIGSLMAMAKSEEEDEQFTPTCYDTEYDVRECTAAEASEKRTEWEKGTLERAESDAKSAEIMKQMIGGFDPTDPKQTEKFIAGVLKQKGWKSIVHKGDGVFDVEYELSGRLDRDFQFPVLEQMRSGAPFVQAIVRNDATVRVATPGLVTEDQSGMQSLMGLAAIGDSSKNEKLPDLPQPDGTFTVTTDAVILTNNTEEGPRDKGGRKMLSWTVTGQTRTAPETLLQLTQ